MPKHLFAHYFVLSEWTSLIFNLFVCLKDFSAHWRTPLFLAHMFSRTLSILQFSNTEWRPGVWATEPTAMTSQAVAVFVLRVRGKSQIRSPVGAIWFIQTKSDQYSKNRCLIKKKKESMTIEKVLARTITSRFSPALAVRDVTSVVCWPSFEQTLWSDRQWQASSEITSFQGWSTEGWSTVLSTQQTVEVASCKWCVDGGLGRISERWQFFNDWLRLQLSDQAFLSFELFLQRRGKFVIWVLEWNWKCVALYRRVCFFAFGAFAAIFS